MAGAHERLIGAGLALLLAGCTGSDDVGRTTPESGEAATEVVLGPVDGHDLPGTDLDRVTAGDIAPDFSALALGGDVHTLSDYRGERNVILFFYRGHW